MSPADRVGCAAAVMRLLRSNISLGLLLIGSLLFTAPGVAHARDFTMVGARTSSIVATPRGATAPAKVRVRLHRVMIVSGTVRTSSWKVVRQLPKARLRPGLRTIKWNGLDSHGHQVRPGRYVIELKIQSLRGSWRLIRSHVNVKRPAVAPKLPTIEEGEFVLQWPVAGTITSGFGWRGGRMHYGVDIPAAHGTPVLAAVAGRVIATGWVDGYGNVVEVDHGGGYSTLYAHLASVSVEVGADLVLGQQLGTVGRTGSATTDHVHLELRVPGGDRVDATSYLKLPALAAPVVPVPPAPVADPTAAASPPAA